MGAIRLEPKEEQTSGETYRQLEAAIVEAWGAIDEHRIFWDLDDDENPARVTRGFQRVAEDKGIPLVVRRVRGRRCLELSFEDAGKAGGRVRSVDTRESILAVLAESETPLSRGEIVSRSGISPSAWNKRIKEMVSDGEVVKLGHRRDSTYRLPT